METYRVVGIMSGTSLDGVDLALCTFSREDGKWKYKLEEAETVPYNKAWNSFLSSIHTRNAETLVFGHVEYGNYLAQLVKNFLSKHQAKIDFISSHGHTIFHQPSRRFTFQLGDGATISAVTALPVVCDFRSTDVALGGQGAPLVPIGDKLLFAEYDFCLNLGGIANISKAEVAFDACPCNIVLNLLAGEVGKSYDEEGLLAASGVINKELLQRLNNQNYYMPRKVNAKSLGREDVERDFLPLMNSSSLLVQDKLATFCEHVAERIASVINSEESVSSPTILITGGGAYNKYLVERIKMHSKATVVIPENKIIEFKEAIIFGFLGVLRWIGEVNCLKSVTGAERDSVGGAIYYC